MIIGIGSGRCGTQSLARLLNEQPGQRVTHEQLGDQVPWGDAIGYSGTLKGDGDVAFYWLPAVRRLLKTDMASRIICLKRPMGPTVDSYLRKTDGFNPWQDSGARWSKCYPHYPPDISKRTAVERYWHDYYGTAQVLEADFPERFRVFPTDYLNHTQRQRELLLFAGVPVQEQRLDVGIRRNVGAPT